MDQRTRKPMTTHKALHPRNNVDRLYVSRKEWGRGLASIENSVDAPIQRLEDYIRSRTVYSHQKKYWEHDQKENDNKQETKMGRKTTLWAF